MKQKQVSITSGMLEKAVAAGHLFLVYQPKLELRTGRIIGVEALARWQDARRGTFEPMTFIPLVEAAGLIDRFSEWALASALSQWSAWQAEGLDLQMAVNISALNLEHVSFPDMVSRLCSAGGVNPDRLTLELTEGSSQEATRLMDTISRFRLKGIGISLDDFGTGFGSLVQLRKLPFTELKIDRAFVGDLLTSADSRAITRALINLAHELGLEVTAQGCGRSYHSRNAHSIRLRYGARLFYRSAYARRSTLHMAHEARRRSGVKHLCQRLPLRAHPDSRYCLKALRCSVASSAIDERAAKLDCAIRPLVPPGQ